MERRTFILATIAGGLLAAPLGAEGQTAGKVLRIGVLAPVTAQMSVPFIEAFRQGLRELGNVEGQNVALEIRYADGRLERLADLAAELVRLKVDVILAPNNPAIAAAQKATASIPIVMAFATDPVALGFVASLARPGGNITGLTSQFPELGGKRLQLLREAVPTLSMVAVLSDSSEPGRRPEVSEAEASAPAVGVRVRLLEARSPSELDGALTMAIREGAGAVLVGGSSMLIAYRSQLAQHAAKSHLPTMCPTREYVEAGCLMSYGVRFVELFRRAAVFVDKILKGAKPGDLPIEQPTKFELVINLKTAKALGLTIPPSLLQRADQVIE